MGSGGFGPRFHEHRGGEAPLFSRSRRRRIVTLNLPHSLTGASHFARVPLYPVICRAVWWSQLFFDRSKVPESCTGFLTGASILLVTIVLAFRRECPSKR
jgi:hypothetical protein